MSDASGRYSSQFYFGNGFWLGSSSLCRELNNTGINGIDGIPGIDIPPYSVKFHVARIRLDFPSDIEPSTRQVFLGLCLPITCNRTSVSSLLRASADRVEKISNATHHSAGLRMTIVTVKPIPSSEYSILNDPKVYILGSVAGVIFLLMIVATINQYQEVTSEAHIEATSYRINNNEEGIYVDRNLADDRRISMIQKTEKECITPGREGSSPQRTRKPQSDKKRGLWMKCLLAFSPLLNGAKILSTEPAARDSLTCLHGLRVFSLGWVVLVHTYLQVFSIAENKTLRTVTERNFMYQTISNATFSVDTFFFISGLLVTILFYRSTGHVNLNNNHFLKTSSRKFIIMIVYRFIRLTPAYLFVLGMNEIAMKYTQARTVFSPAIIDHVTCEKFWWRNALYINSLYPRTEMCMLWSWYMANDTQFYVLGIFFLLVSMKYLKFVAGTVFLLIVSSWFTTFSIAYSNDYVARIQEPFALFDELYDKPWLRAGPYFIGGITGWILFKTNCGLRTPMWGKIIGWTISGGTMAAVVYGLYAGDLGVTISSIYAALGHSAWAIAVAFIVVQCCTGSASFVNGLLSLKLLYPLSRLTYCAYLVHPIIMMITSMQMDGPLHLHNGLVLILYFGNLVASYLLSFCVSITLEAPIVNLLKFGFPSSKDRR
ncbi:nose resistant to fluoxetine protein 6-like isoform X2 [Diachasmimorpha longicaudata]